MKGNQWSLVIFTVLIQLAVGLFLFSGVVQFLIMDQVNAFLSVLFFRVALLTVIAGLLAGLLISLSHLGSLRNAPRALLNLGSSWLSAEIALVGLFRLMVASYGILFLLGLGLTFSGKVVFCFGCGVGLLLIYCMTRVYRLSTIPTWDTLATQFSFFKATFLLGVSATGGLLWVSLAISIENIEMTTIVQNFNRNFLGVVVFAVLLLGLDYLVTIFRIAKLKGNPENMDKGFSRAVSQNYTSFTLRFILGALGLILFSLPLIWNPYTLDFRWFKISLIPLSFGLIFISELIDRKVFYASFERAGF